MKRVVYDENAVRCIAYFIVTWVALITASVPLYLKYGIGAVFDMLKISSPLWGGITVLVAIVFVVENLSHRKG